MRAAAIVQLTIAGVHAAVAVATEARAGQSVARARVAAERVGTPILAQAVAVAQQTLVDIFASCRGRASMGMSIFVDCTTRSAALSWQN